MRQWLHCLILLLMLTNCGAANAVSEITPLLLDNHFSRGVTVTPLSSQRYGLMQRDVPVVPPVCLPLKDCSSKPVWQLQQWSNAQDIVVADSDLFSWTLFDQQHQLQKRLVLKPLDPLEGDAIIEMNGLSEFAARSEDDAPHYLPDLRRHWPHWLLTQPLQSGRLAQYKHLQLQGQFRLLFDDPQRLPGYDPGVHAARLLIAMTVRNRLTGDYFWLTLPLYDDRYNHTDFGCQKCTHNGERCYTPKMLVDPGTWRCPEDRVGEQWWKNEKSGTARMIFRVPTRDFVHGAAKSGHWIQVSGDLMPYLEAGIEAVRLRENGRSFPPGLFFYELGIFSLGWEITGFNHVSAQLRDWQLEAQ
jgi:hypothetical protein